MLRFLREMRTADTVMMMSPARTAPAIMIGMYPSLDSCGRGSVMMLCPGVSDAAGGCSVLVESLSDDLGVGSAVAGSQTEGL